MDVILLTKVLAWSLAINYAILMFWFIAFTVGRRWIFTLHTRWFRLSEESFDTVHYAGMAVYKIGIFLFNLAPLLALGIAGAWG